uniref:WAP domain-containing protein n=1 Tax=Terrapene triunguis TaxID=2587831 RepID=A0A674IYT4_9SAUR
MSLDSLLQLLLPIPALAAPCSPLLTTMRPGCGGPKPGTCPPDPAKCRHAAPPECDSDGGCPGRKKCCFRTCAMRSSRSWSSSPRLPSSGARWCQSGAASVIKPTEPK